jgi:hypothetical protein
MVDDNKLFQFSIKLSALLGDNRKHLIVLDMDFHFRSLISDFVASKNMIRTLIMTSILSRRLEGFSSTGTDSHSLDTIYMKPSLFNQASSKEKKGFISQMSLFPRIQKERRVIRP